MADWICQAQVNHFVLEISCEQLLENVKVFWALDIFAVYIINSEMISSLCFWETGQAKDSSPLIDFLWKL